VAFIAAHPGQIGLITISIGGNDFDNCIGQADPVSCVAAAMPVMKANVETLVSELRTAAGSSVPMIATSYPDVVLGVWVANPPNQAFAKLSITAFSLLINPNLSQAYATGNVTFVNVTAATGAFTPLTTTVKLAPYGTIPKAVAQVCTLTWFCEKGDIHPKPAGYTLIAKLVAAAYAKLAK
jgi:lysophospholipase L1-like esterase